LAIHFPLLWPSHSHFGKALSIAPLAGGPGGGQGGRTYLGCDVCHFQSL
jgi:hypothetical protein